MHSASTGRAFLPPVNSACRSRDRLRRRFRLAPIPAALAVLLAGGLTAYRPAAAAEAPRLESVSVMPATGDQATVDLHLSAPLAHDPTGFSVQQPAQVVIDLPGAASDVHGQRLDTGPLLDYQAVSVGSETRVVFDLQHSVGYEVDAQGKDVRIRFGQPVARPAVASGTDTGATPASSAGVPIGASQQDSIEHIEFHRTVDGGGRITVLSNGPQARVDVQQQDGRVTARFHDTQVGDDLLKRLDVLDFATPVRFIDTRRDGDDTVLTVTPVTTGDWQQIAFQSAGRFTLDLEPLTEQEVAQRELAHPKYTGRKITLDFQNVDLRALLQIIADVAQTNMIVSDSVKGDVAIRLDDVPWDQALAIILESKGLGQQHSGNVIFIAPMEEIAARHKAEMEAQQQSNHLAPLESHVIQVNYAKATDIAKVLQADKDSLLGSRGKVTVDPRTNTLLVLDTASKIASIRDLVKRLDVPVRQVEIKSRIVITNNTYDRQIGAQLGITGIGSIGGKGLIATSGSAVATNDALSTNGATGGYTMPGLSSSTGTSGASSTTSTSSSNSSTINFDSQNNERYNVNLPITATNPAGIALGILGAHSLVDLELQAMQSEGKGEVVSNPRVITTNGEAANIEQGTEIPYQEGTSSGATSVSFKKAVLGLTVTPQITPDGRIIMDLAVRDDSVGQNVPTGNGGTAPSIDTHSVTTQVLVNDGQTVVLGGIYQNTRQTSTSKVPLLGDIPILGALFRSTEHQNNRNELMVFITPRIINRTLSMDSGD